MDTHRHFNRAPVAARAAWQETRFVWMAAGIATAFALIGALIIAGAGSTPVGQILAVVVGFLGLGAGGVFALALAAGRDTGDWPW
ncbi:MAG: hypothetical protein ABI920_00940 [Casimicrobiaceae bacterium]